MLTLTQCLQQSVRPDPLDAILQDAAPGFLWDLLDQLADGIYILDPDRNIRYWSSGAARLTGYKAEEVLGLGCADNVLCHVDARGNHLCEDGCPLAAVLQDGQPRTAEVFLRHKAGHRVPVRVHGAAIRDRYGQIIGAYQAFRPTRSATASAERLRELEHAAFVDSLTGVANRRFLEHELQHRLADGQQHGWEFGLVLCDIDHFKQFNDRYGHNTGDDVLKMVARTLTNAVGAGDLVGRWGGEKFLVIANSASEASLDHVAERARFLVASSALKCRHKMLRVTISAGAAWVRPGDDLVRLLGRAERFLYARKSAGRDCVTSERSCRVPANRRLTTSVW